ncbi:hypothetical protein [Methanobrevibacter sp.]|uniref:hypothetical protein n=1 Tax=Methanobrevibacter sp. TaxID=66852 RepID=UPI0038906402
MIRLIDGEYYLKLTPEQVSALGLGQSSECFEHNDDVYQLLLNVGLYASSARQFSNKPIEYIQSVIDWVKSDPKTANVASRVYILLRDGFQPPLKKKKVLKSYLFDKFDIPEQYSEWVVHQDPVKIEYVLQGAKDYDIKLSWYEIVENLDGCVKKIKIVQSQDTQTQTMESALKRLGVLN